MRSTPGTPAPAADDALATDAPTALPPPGDAPAPVLLAPATTPVPAPAPAPAEAGPRDRSARSEARNAAVRATLEPLAPGQRPRWVTYAAVLATVLGVLNVALYAAGVRVAGAGFTSAVVQGAVLLVCAAGMWRAKYWAVLGFEVLMGVTTAFGALSLLVASSLRGALIALGVVVICGTFFWKLIRAMARIQMPDRPGTAGF